MAFAAPAEALAAKAINLAVALMRWGFLDQDGRRGVVNPKVPIERTSGLSGTVRPGGSSTSGSSQGF